MSIAVCPIEEISKMFCGKHSRHSCHNIHANYICANNIHVNSIPANYYGIHVAERRPSAVCSRVGVGSSHCPVYFHHRMTVLDFFQGNPFSQRRFRMSHSSKKGSTTQLYLGSDFAYSAVAGWATS